MTRALAGRWLLLAVVSCLAAWLIVALVEAPAPARAGLPPDTLTVSRLATRPSENIEGLRSTASLTDTYAAIIAAETVLDPILTATFLPFTAK